MIIHLWEEARGILYYGWLCRTVIIYLPASYIHSFQLHTSRITWPSSTDGLSEESSLICDCATPRQEAAAFFKAILSEHIHAKLLAFKRLNGELDRWIDSRASSGKLFYVQRRLYMQKTSCWIVLVWKLLRSPFRTSQVLICWRIQGFVAGFKGS